MDFQTMVSGTISPLLNRSSNAWRTILAAPAVLMLMASQPNAQTAVCSNSETLDPGFISLISDQFDTDRDVLLNPDASSSKEAWPGSDLQVYVASGDYGSVLRCVEYLGVDPARVDQEVQGLREKLGPSSEVRLSADQEGVTTDVGALFVLAEKDVFIRVSKEESLMSAAAAVFAALNLNEQSCWLNQECLKAVEAYWAK
ncbi:hypothetical protein [Parasedimentitalea huanghaiensis]|uniref:Uncharacterized protein n=1 Tax=Parasedimentitalea huanghaiensis TaxID=2682100 RepID=A0A6L6WGD0_9RHOB|nr:hypothetical protein [Zongyanglinia huanghaiensis]MVO14732.1 hypothetical protein [Zongyanglinia huanghaiensis]